MYRYELINEPWAGGIFRDLSYILPGVTGKRNLAPLYERIHTAIRSEDDNSIVFWEPVTWGYVFPFKAHPVRDTLIKGFMSQFTILDVLDYVRAICGDDSEFDIGYAQEDFTTSSKAFLAGITATIGTNYEEQVLNPQKLVDKLNFYLKSAGKIKRLEVPTVRDLNSASIFGPGFRTPPGGPGYLDRTVFSWHYYCWALGTEAEGREDYDPALEELCDNGWGPLTFETVKQRASELGNSATFLTEFGTCNPDVNYPDSAGTKECEFVISQMDQRFESWAYWDATNGSVFWVNDGDQWKPEVLKFFSRPYPRAMAGTPLNMTFDPFCGRFELTFIQSPVLSRITELFVPQTVHYGEERLGYKVSHSEDLLIEGYPFGETLKVRKRVGSSDENGISYIRIEPTDSACSSP